MGLDQLPEYQNVTTFAHNIFEANALLKYANLSRAQGAVDDEKGTKWGIYSRLYYADSAFPRLWGNYDRGFLLPRNSAFWVRTSAGKSLGDFNSPFSSFYFGAFGNNYIDHQEVDRYRDYYSFPGVGIDAIAARSFGKVLGGVQPSAQAIPRLRRHLVLRELGPAHFVLVRAVHQLHQRSHPRLLRESGNTTGFPSWYCLLI